MKTTPRSILATAVIAGAACLTTFPAASNDCPARVGRWLAGPSLAVASESARPNVLTVL